MFRILEARSPRLEAARQMAFAAEARIKPASTLPDPQLQFGLMNRNLPGFGLQDPLGMNQVQVMQMVPIAGQLGLAGRGAAAQAGAARARAAELGWDLRARAAMSFYEIYQLDRTIEVSLATQGLLRDIADDGADHVLGRPGTPGGRAARPGRDRPDERRDRAHARDARRGRGPAQRAARPAGRDRRSITGASPIPERAGTG